MGYNPHVHHRRSIRLKGYDYSQAGAYFITICCHNRHCMFGKIPVGQGSPLPLILIHHTPLPLTQINRKGLPLPWENYGNVIITNISLEMNDPIKPFLMISLTILQAGKRINSLPNKILLPKRYSTGSYIKHYTLTKTHELNNKNVSRAHQLLSRHIIVCYNRFLAAILKIKLQKPV